MVIGILACDVRFRCVFFSPDLSGKRTDLSHLLERLFDVTVLQNFLTTVHAVLSFILCLSPDQLTQLAMTVLINLILSFLRTCCSVFFVVG